MDCGGIVLVNSAPIIIAHTRRSILGILNIKRSGLSIMIAHDDSQPGDTPYGHRLLAATGSAAAAARRTPAPTYYFSS